MRKKQIVVLCDVSGSMIQFSEFVLRFIQSLNQASGSSRVFLFSEELREADAFHLQNMDLFRETGEFVLFGGHVLRFVLAFHGRSFVRFRKYSYLCRRIEE